MDKSALIAAIIEVFLPDFSISARALVKRAIDAYDFNEIYSIVANTGYEPPPDLRRSVHDLCSEKRLHLLRDLVSTLPNSLAYAQQGVELLNDFPAQRLAPLTPSEEPLDWREFWHANGGKFYTNTMVALKWDTIWWRISFFASHQAAAVKKSTSILAI